MIEQLKIGYEDVTLFEQARYLAEQLKLEIDNQASKRLLLTKERLVLKLDNFSALYADFSSKTWQKRHNEGKKQGLVKACKPTNGLRIIDATAGWGRDSAVLASFGAEVLMLERQPIMAALLADALMRQDEESKARLKLTLCQTSSINYLQSLAFCDYPDVIYMDPMHPSRQKAALVKKDMQALQQLIGTDSDALELLELAQKRVLKRVVVKWPQHLSPLLKPTASVPGKTVRFDIYGHTASSN